MYIVYFLTDQSLFAWSVMHLSMCLSSYLHHHTYTTGDHYKHQLTIIVTWVVNYVPRNLDIITSLIRKKSEEIWKKLQLFCLLNMIECTQKETLSPKISQNSCSLQWEMECGDCMDELMQHFSTDISQENMKIIKFTKSSSLLGLPNKKKHLSDADQRGALHQRRI